MLTVTQRAILRALEEKGAMTDEEIARAVSPIILGDASPSGLRTRRSELVEQGLIVDSGRRKRLSSGREAVVWVSAKGSPKREPTRGGCPECGEQLYDVTTLLGGFSRGKCLIHGVQVARLG